MTYNKIFPVTAHNSSAKLNEAPEYVDLEAVFRVVMRQWKVVALCVFAALFVALVYVFTAVPLYTSNIAVLIDKGNGEIVERLSPMGGVVDDETSVLSQVEVLTSDTIALAVVDRLNLGSNREFLSASGLPLRTLSYWAKTATRWLKGAPPYTSEELRRQAADRLIEDVEVERVGKTYVLEISFVSTSADLSAAVANAIGDEYLNDKLNAKFEATRHASNWLQDRIAELRQKALESDLAVQKFRSANGLVTAGAMLMSDQQLSELNTALINAQADTSKSRARLERIEHILASGQIDAIVTDMFDNTIANDLRMKYMNSAKTEAELANRLGASHEQVVKLRNEMDEYKRLMFEELKRTAEAYKSDLQVAEARQEGLLQSVSNATGVSAVANETQVQLRELEREAETYRELYQSFLQRYQQAIQQQSFPVTDARVITRALPAVDPSHPRKPLFLALALVLGLSVGSAAGAVREFRDRFFRTGDQVRDVLGLDLLGNAPLLSARDPKGAIRPGGLTDYATENPLSAFAETLKSAKLAADLSQAGVDHKIIGIVSSLPGEGKSTIAVNLAKLMASQGARTILIDADLRNPATTRALAANADKGILEAILGKEDPFDLLTVDPKTGLRFLPAPLWQRVPNSSDLLASYGMRQLLNKLSEDSDYVIVDLPPLAPVIDARAIASRIDAFVFVIEWGKTARHMARQVLESAPLVRDKCLGAILNKVDNEKMKLYRSYGTMEYYNSQYTSYYHGDKA